jgi:hypothetical protein
MTLEQVIALLQEHANPQAVQGMARFGISSAQTLVLQCHLGQAEEVIGTSWVCKARWIRVHRPSPFHCR